MKRLLLFALHFLSTSTSLLVAQSSCTSSRYIDTIFHDVQITSNVYFASAVPYLGILPEDLYFDVYQPANDTLTNRPVIVYQFGGGFVIGWDEEPDIPQFGTYFAQLGYVVVTIQYRLGLDPLDSSSGVRAFYRATQDERSAIRFLSQNATQFGIDTSRIILTGTSAGCFCSFANSYMNDSDWPSEIHGIPSDPTDLGCMDCSGNTDLGHHIPHPLAIINMWGAILDTNFITLSQNVPTVSFQGNDDVLVPYNYGYPFQLPFVFPEVYGGLSIHQRMVDVGILDSWHPLVGYGHEPELLAPQLLDTIYNYSRVFLYPLLQPQTSTITGDSIVCKGAEAVYSVTNTPGSWYCWSLTGNGEFINNNSTNTVTVLWRDTGAVSVSVTEMNDIDAEGAPRIFQTQVIEHSQPDFTDTANQLQVKFTNTSIGAIRNYWTFGNKDTSAEVDPVENYMLPGTYTVTLYSNNGGCTDSISKTITIDTCPTAHFSATANALNVVFVADTTNSASYFWNYGDGESVIVLDTRTPHTYRKPGTYLISLEVKNSLGCTVVDTFSITVDTCPVARFTEQVNGSNVAFAADSTNTIAYFWNYGDGDTASVFATHVFHTYQQPGTYLVSLEVKNTLGCSAVDTFSITIDNCPVARFTVSITALSVAFAAHTTNTIAYQWNYGDGDSASVSTTQVAHTYEHPGTYLVILKVKDSLGCSAIDTFSINVDPCPIARFTVRITGLYVAFAADSTNTTTYFWNYGDGDTASVSATSVSHNYQGPGTYLVSLQVKNPSGCSAIDTFSITVDTCPIARFAAYMKGLYVAFAAERTNTTAYFWNYGDGDTSSVSTTQDSHNYEHPGTYLVTLKVSNHQGCTSLDTFSITLDTCPVAHLTPWINGLDVLFTADSTDTKYYSWSYGDGDSTTVSTMYVTHTYQNAGSYVVTLEVDNLEGCAAIDTLSLTVNQLTGMANLPGLAATINCDNSSGCYINLVNTGIATLELFDITGRKLFEQSIQDNYWFDTSELASGVYLLRVSNDSSAMVRKIFKQ